MFENKDSDIKELKASVCLLETRVVKLVQLIE